MMKVMFVLAALAVSTVAQADPWKVEIKPATTTWWKHKPVQVTLRLVNTSTTPRSTKVMSCSWGSSWKVGDSDFAWDPWGCDKNVAMTITLDPGKSREWTLAMYAVATAKPGAHDLALTFTPDGGGAPVKSAPVRITIR
jgi:hypothetical protein